MTNTFAFVDNFAIDGPSRKEIRSHVMRGKNTSKARTSASRKIRHNERERQQQQQQQQQEQEQQKQPQHDDVGNAKGQPLELIFHNSRGHLRATALMPQQYASLKFPTLKDDFSCLDFPVPMNDRLHLLMKQFYLSYGRYIYPVEFCFHEALIETPWFRYTLEDKAYCYGTLAISVACWDHARGRKKLSPEYKQYFSMCLSHLNKKLSETSKARESSTVALVMGLCILAATLADFQAVKLHVDGLRHLVNLRGGIRTMVHEPPVMEKIIRTDIEDAINTGKPAFFPTELGDYVPPIVFPKTLGAEFPRLDRIRRLDAGLAEAAQEVHLLSRYLSSLGRVRLTPWIYQIHVTYTFCKVIRLGPIACTVYTNSTAELTRVTLVALMSILTVQLGIPNEKRFDVLIYRLTGLVDSIAATDLYSNAAADPLVYNWALHILASTILRDTKTEWLRTKMVSLRAVLGFETWQEAHAAAQEYPWLPPILDSHIERLWGGEAWLSPSPSSLSSD